MKRVKIADAKNNLSRHLQYVRKGGRVRILDRDTPVADLIPIEPAGPGDGDLAELEALERRGVLKRGQQGRLPRELLEPGPCGTGGESGVLDALLAERSNSR